MIIRVKDGDTLSVIVELDSSLHDPALQFPGVGQSFRVVAGSQGPILELIPLSNYPVLLSDLGDKGCSETAVNSQGA